MKVNNGQINSAKGDIVRLLSQVMSNQVVSCHCRHLGVDRIENIAVRSTDPENRTLEQNMMRIG